jgi:hypothetical protein
MSRLIERIEKVHTVQYVIGVRERETKCEGLSNRSVSIVDSHLPVLGEVYYSIFYIAIYITTMLLTATSKAHAREAILHATVV